MRRVIGNLKLAKKLLVSPTTAIAFLLVIGVTAFSGMQTLKGAIGEIFQKRFKVYMETTSLSETIADAQGNLYKLITWARANYDSGKLDALGKAQIDRIDSVINGMKSMADSADDEETKGRLQKALAQTIEYRKAAFTVVDFATVELNTATISMGTAEDKFNVLASTLRTENDTQRKLAEASYGQAMGSYTRVILMFLVMSAAAIVLSILATLFINGLIVRPVRATTEVIHSVAAGDLSTDVPVETSDEIGDMARSFNVMLANLRTLLGKITTATGTMAGASTQISSSTEQMAAGAHEQTSQAGEVASAV
ncbi:MAG TPA: methyl-accepting chemotaxis protein, partial [Bacteroidota bacterium]|nr:methyl-accepting chemotaxis protein [Bacteroidota bacterium]